MGESEKRIIVGSIEILATSRCNLRCAHCTANSPFMEKHYSPNLGKLKDTLTILSKLMHSKQVKILGGEPLLYKHLIELMKIVKESHFCDCIRVCTNGILLDQVSEDFWHYADVIEISHYLNVKKAPSNQRISKYTIQAELYNTKLEVNDIQIFQESFVSTPITNNRLVKGIFRECREVHEIPCYTIDNSSFFLCSRIHNLECWLNSLGNYDLGFYAEAELKISERPSLREELINYLKRDKPFKACQYCLGTSGKTVVHRQLSIEEIRMGSVTSDSNYIESAIFK